ncbi:MAG: [FeFe] hydrogenase H-cluster radical SAM maturase HydE [Clostridiales bacterium]
MKNYLIVAKNTSEMILINKTLKSKNIETDLVPAPPETGTVCAIAVKFSKVVLDRVKIILKIENLKYIHLIEEKKLKLQGLIDKNYISKVSYEFIDILKKIEDGKDLNLDDIEYLLKTDKKKEEEIIFSTADRIRKETVGDVVEIRGAIEFSNYCKKNCKYCGISGSNNTVKRYRMDEEEIMDVVYYLKSLGIKTVILQSGEDSKWNIDRLIPLIKRIKKETKMKITLSVGEKTKEEYKILKEAGGDNFLLKIETTNRELFKKIHPDDDYDYRIKCSKWLKELGYINGSGNILGLPGQTIRDLAGDILFFKNMGINMIGIGPFIPAKGSEYENMEKGDINLTIRAVATTRIVCQKVFIPSTTALASLSPDAQIKALKAGANTIMLINTPKKYRDNYNIYDNKNMVDLQAAFEATLSAGRKLPSYLNIESVR